MSHVLTEGTNLAIVREATMGSAVPPTSGWFNLQPNSYGSYGPSYKKLPRSPISKNRQHQKGMLVDADTAMPFEADITKDLIDVFLGGIFMSAVKHSGGTGQSLFRPTVVVDGGGSADEYTVAADGDLPASSLIYARGFRDAANNGLKLVAASSTDTAILVATGSLVAEAAVATTSPGATVEVAGFQFASGDATLNSSGNIVVTTADFTTMGLNVGQWIWVGGGTAAAPGALGFVDATYRGFARIKSITATTLELERRSWTVGAADAGTAKTVQIFFSRWARNVPIDHTDHLVQSYAAEVTYPNLGGAGVPKYEVMHGLHVDDWVWNLPLATKASTSITLTGTTTDDPATARVTGPATALSAVCNLGVSTSTDLMRLRVSNADESGISTDFSSIKITMKNNVEPEKQLGTLGAVIVNVGKFAVEVDADVIFTSSDVIAAIHDNRTVSMDVAMRNGDFGFLLDCASMTIDSGDRKLETNKSVIITSKMMGFQDASLGYTASGSMFAYLPSS